MNSSLMQELGLSVHPEAVSNGVNWTSGTGKNLTVRSPIDDVELASFKMADANQVPCLVDSSTAAFKKLRLIPAPRRGDFVRRFAETLREHQDPLSDLIVYEVGKITAEARGEVQEMIDVCDFAVGLSRQLYGKTIASERPQHRMTEQWHPLGPVGVISAFNFPTAVWAWNAAIGWICGDPIIWKPSEKTPLTAIACQALFQKTVADDEEFPADASCLIVGDRAVGEALTQDPRIPLISATGSVPMGRAVASTVAARLGRSLLELGGNNAMIVTPSSNIDLAVRSITFSAAGTCGQRCTTLRRLIVHTSVADALVNSLKDVFLRLPIGDPRDKDTLVGPLIDDQALQAMQKALGDAQQQGGRVSGGEQVTDGVPVGGCYVRPAIVEIDANAKILQEETFAPILYVVRYSNFEEAISIHNNVPQGLSSAILTSDVNEAEYFVSPAGSDCGIANVNIGTSGAEIGGAFGGEKETGGGRESGSDSWKQYMRRATNTINYSPDLPLAQGIRFNI
jgi:aldehyde dehydrogenase (NAD+)